MEVVRGGPIGIGTVRVAGSGRSAVLTDKDGVETRLEDAELELRYRSCRNQHGAGARRLDADLDGCLSGLERILSDLFVILLMTLVGYLIGFRFLGGFPKAVTALLLVLLAPARAAEEYAAPAPAPHAVRSFAPEVDGAIYLRKVGDRLELTGPGRDSTEAHFSFQVPEAPGGSG